MNDKEKQIREIAKVIMEAIQGETHLVKPANVFEAAAEATALYNAKCRILPEDSVVITREEYEKFLKVNSELAVSQKSISFLSSELNDYKQRYESVEKRYEQLVQSSCEALEKGKAQARKETAREILKDIDKELYDISRIYLEAVTKNGKDEDAMNKYGVMSIAHDVVINIAKQYGIEIKE